MVQMKAMFMMLHAEITSILRPEITPIVNGKHIIEPWGYENMPKFLRFTDHDDPDYPRDGISNISKDNADIQEFLVNENSWEKFQEFLQAFRLKAFQSHELYEITVQSPRNEYREGAKIAMKYLKKLFDRAKCSAAVDDMLRRLNNAPYQVYERSLAKWPSRREKDKEQVSSQINNSVAPQ